MRPSPAHSGHGVGTTVPKPWHCGQGREVMTWPRKDRVTCETSPRPRHMSQVCAVVPGAAPSPLHVVRSEEHTSELQSRENLVCRLLLEKKKETERDY